MYLKSKALYIYTESPIHAGAGASLSAVDLPIQRERISGFPVIHASGLKGSLKDAARYPYKTMPDVLDAIFGPDDPKYSAALGVGDARILLFPVRSIKGVFAWTTCSVALERWARAVGSIHSLPTIPSAPVGSEPDGTPHCYALNGLVDPNQYVVLEDVVFKNQPEPTDNGILLISKLAEWLADVVFAGQPEWQNRLKQNLIVLPDEEFAFFVQHATEVLTRVRLVPDTKTVQTGALWTEEHLPEDTLLFAPIHARRIMSPSTDAAVQALRDGQDPANEAAKILAEIEQKLTGTLQIGGDETTGCGFSRIIWK